MATQLFPLPSLFRHRITSYKKTAAIVLPLSQARTLNFGYAHPE